MKQKSNAKKGITLIEAIISVALLAILIIPLSNVVLAAFQTNKDGEIKQKASFAGQKILEEMEAYDEVKLEKDVDNKNFFKVLDGESITEENPGTNSYSAGLPRNNFRVVLTMVKDSNFNYNTDNNSENLNNRYDLSYELSNDSGGTPQYISQEAIKKTFVGNNLTLKIDSSNIANVFKENSSIGIFLDKTLTVPLKNKILIKLNSTFPSTLNLNVDSAITGTTQIYIIKDTGCTSDVNIASVKGNIQVNRYMNLTGGEKIADLYNIDVKVYKGEATEVLFQGNTKKNITVK